MDEQHSFLLLLRLDQVVSATHANVIPRTQLLSNNEREKIYDRASRLLTESERTQGNNTVDF